MRGGLGFIVSVVVVAIGLLGLGFAADQMMTHADPNSNAKAAAGLVTFVIASLAAVVVIR